MPRPFTQSGPRWARRPGQTEAPASGPPAGFDYYLSPDGSDSGAGTISDPWQTSAKLVTVVNALANGASKTAYVSAGTYGTFYFAPTNTITIDVTFQAGTTVDTTASLTDNGVGSGNTATATFRFGAGCTLTGTGTNGANTPNGVSAATSAQVTVYGAPEGAAEADWLTVTGYADGISSHNTASVTVYRTRVQNNDKGAMVNVNTSTATLVDVVLTGRSGASSGLVAHQSTGAATYTRVQFVPATAAQTVELGRGAYTLTSCVLGTTSVRVAISNGNAVSTEDGSFTDCYLNASFDTRSKMTFAECYGKLSMRVRGANTVGDLVMRNCCWVGNASGLSTGFLYANTYTDPSWVGIGYDIRDTIVTGYGTAVGSGFAAAQTTEFNAASSLTYCCLYGNTTNYAAGVTGTAQTGNITTNPLIGAANTTTQADYGYGPGSPCVAAGFGGGNIGFAA